MVKTDESWTDLPNLMGDREKVKEMANSGDAGMELAAMGAIGAALNKMNEERGKPADPRFLYPTSRQFPFDEVTYDIVKELESRHFTAPGIKVDFHNYGPSDSYKMVSAIEADDFRLWFCRVQGSLGAWNDTAAVTQLNIPKKELNVFDDNSGPTLYLYVGKNWKNDKEKFVHSGKVNSKLNNEPKTYLEYKGAWRNEPGVTYTGRVAPSLAHTNDLGRQYDPTGKEPTFFKTADVFKEFKTYLENRLKVIRELPKA
jgi:hypothetical protein